MDSESLTFLLGGGHYDVPTRIARGIWPHPPLRFDDLVAHLVRLISERRWFPYEFIPHQPGKAVDEFGVLERVAENRFVYHAEGAFPLDPRSLARSVHKTFSSAEDAARYYLKWSLHLPGDLDSWRVV